jgi:hypothetical protein
MGVGAAGRCHTGPLVCDHNDKARGGARAAGSGSGRGARSLVQGQRVLVGLLKGPNDRLVDDGGKGSCQGEEKRDGDRRGARVGGQVAQGLGADVVGIGGERGARPAQRERASRRWRSSRTSEVRARTGRAQLGGLVLLAATLRGGLGGQDRKSNV